MTDDRDHRARQIVQSISYVTVATVSPDGMPWNSPVYASFDADGNFFWISSPMSQHSVNVAHNSAACLVIYDSTAPEGTGEGVYIEASVETLNDLDRIESACRHLARRKGKHADPRPAQFLEGGIQRVYQATPHRIWMNDVERDDDGQHVRDIRVELPAATLRKLMSSPLPPSTTGKR